MATRLLFVALRPPFPLASGARIRSHRLLTGLANAFEVTFLTFEHHERSAEGHMTRRELEQLLPGVRVMTVPGRAIPKRLGQLGSLASRRSWTFGRYASEPLAHVAADAVQGGVAIVHLDDLGVASVGPFPGAVNVYSAHNVEQRIVEATSDGSKGLRRLFADVELRKVRREEERAWTSMSLCLAVSPVDAAVMRAGGARVEVCPNGTDPVDRLPFPARRADEPLRLLFVGSVDYQPNYTGLKWFLDEVFPRVREIVPSVLDVVGSRRRALPIVEGVVYHGQVPSVLPFYKRAHIAVVPVLFGSGTRLKVVEAMGLGRPVVATTAGAEGLPVTAGVHYVAADDGELFARALAGVARQAQVAPAELEGMLERAYSAISDLFWPQIVERLIETYQAELEEHNRAAEIDSRR
jgi:glycosyltransferase involved in cell wall biosynthesis